MAARDYYDVLGVPRNATDDAIKRAYRSLVRKHHPDVSKDKKDAGEKFKEVQEAYEVLSDKKKRAAYDQFGHAGVGMGAGATPGGYERWAYGPGGAKVYTWSDFGKGGGPGVDFGDLFGDLFSGGRPFGKRRSRTTRGVHVPERPQRGENIEHKVTLSFEHAVWGTSMRIQLQRPDANGSVKTETIDVKIPPGVSEGSKVRVKGKGNAGHGRQPPGDLYIVVHVSPHPYFRREGHDIHLDVPITVAEAVRGAKITIPTIDGPTVVTIPPGTSSGRKLRLKGKGAPDPKTKQRGDQYAVIRIVAPAQAPSGIDKTLDELDQACGQPRENLGWNV